MSTLKCFITETGVSIEDKIVSSGFKTLNNITTQQQRYIDSEWLFFTENETAYGSIKLSDIDWKNNHAILDISWKSQELKPAITAIEWFVNTIFGNTPFCRLHTQVQENSPMKEALSEAGFAQEVLLRKHAFIDGDYRNISWMGICRDSVKQQ